jgi:N,N'-diacetylchitobiose transport system substrate-binding protein
VYSQGAAASIIGPGWYSCCVGAKFKSNTAQFVMPSHTNGQPMPGFLGGSDLAVPAPSKNVALGADWIKDFTGTDAEKGLQAKGNIPNATSLLGTSVNERAAARSWFVPAAKHWVDVENGNILRNMLAQILLGKLSVAQAAASASDNITSVLNGA